MEADRVELHLHRARELRAIAHFIGDRRKQETLHWLARDEEHMAAEQNASEPAGLVRRLHLLGIAQQLHG